MTKKKQNLVYTQLYIFFFCCFLILIGCEPNNKIMTAQERITGEPTREVIIPESATPIPVIIPTTAKTPDPNTNSISSTVIPQQNPTQIQSYPDEFYITEITGHHQYFSLGCEASAAVDWAAFYGLEINEFEFQYKIPSSDNPDTGFVGSVDGPWGQVPPYAYGVHAGPIADILNIYGVSAQSVKDYTLDQLKAQIAQGNPVIAWVIGNCVGGIPYEYTDSQGNQTIVAAYEHVIILTGYNKESIRYLNNGNFYNVPNEVFLNSWAVLGNMAVIKSD